MHRIQRTSQVVEFSLCCIKSWKGNKKTPAGGVKKGNIKRWHILKKNNNLIFAHGLMVGRLFAELSVFLFCGDDDGPGSVTPSRDGVILSPLCSSSWSFPFCTDRWATSHHSTMEHNRAQDIFCLLFHYGRLDLTCIYNTDSWQLMSLRYTGATIKPILFLNTQNGRPFCMDFVSSPRHDKDKVV